MASERLQLIKTETNLVIRTICIREAKPNTTHTIKRFLGAVTTILCICQPQGALGLFEGLCKIKSWTLGKFSDDQTSAALYGFHKRVSYISECRSDVFLKDILDAQEMQS